MNHAPTPTWFKSSRSNNGGSCVEVSPSLPTTVPVRDSTNPAGPALTFPRDAFAAFVAELKNGTLATT
ncbi:DUF397 domain-containing protein [Kitasatospora acidiphila]|uniref:DUF397 domain-containing protein n=1 Tax=Kitasatospora acidiphila TaxID=2567942 RepID=A0A540W0G8_9ACTN|nr:DUF397 domain-containing protein [Kitasatospora acidiphila]TQF02519.1 DUF397 domain-containing protein [Kitasatospora acidiphila]